MMLPLPAGIPSLKHDNRPLRAAEIGLLDELKNPLQRRQTLLVIGKIQFGEFGNFREMRAARDGEFLGVHSVRPIGNRWLLRPGPSNL